MAISEGRWAARARGASTARAVRSLPRKSILPFPNYFYSHVHAPRSGSGSRHHALGSWQATDSRLGWSGETNTVDHLHTPPSPDHTMVPGVAGVNVKSDPTRALGPLLLVNDTQLLLYPRKRHDSGSHAPCLSAQYSKRPCVRNRGFWPASRFLI